MGLFKKFFSQKGETVKKTKHFGREKSGMTYEELSKWEKKHKSRELSLDETNDFVVRVNELYEKH